MSSRADFYLGRDPQTMVWLGSIAMDGYPEQFLTPTNPERREWDLLPVAQQYAPGTHRPSPYLDILFDENPITRATTSDEFLAAAMWIIDGRDDGTSAENGWPWPWADSSTSSWIYAFDDGELYVSKHGGPWHQPQLGIHCPADPASEAYWEARDDLRKSVDRLTPQLRRIGATKDGAVDFEHAELPDEIRAAKAAHDQAKTALDAFERPTFPNMTSRKNVAWGMRSGVTVVDLAGLLSGEKPFGVSMHEA